MTRELDGDSWRGTGWLAPSYCTQDLAGPLLEVIVDIILELKDEVS